MAPSVPGDPATPALPPHQIDEEFRALPTAALTDAALQTARDLGVSHADIRVERLKESSLSFRDAGLESRSDGVTAGFAVRVVHDGTWGFAAGVDLTVDEAVRVAREAVAMAKVARPLNSEPVELADEPVHAGATWVSAYGSDPFAIDPRDQIERVGGLCRTLFAAQDVDHVDGHFEAVMENKFYADTAGTDTSQQRVRVICQLEATRVDPAGGFETMRTIAPPVGRGWEWMVAGPAAGCWDWEAELDLIPSLLAEKAKASSVEPGRYDLVVDPSNLWLTIHESVGHATELDRALGYEAAYAGTSFATLDQLGSLRYGSPAMTVTGDRTAPHGLATIGYDDEGVRTGRWDIVRDGVLVGYQLDRRMAAQNAAALGVDRSNGCAFADSPGHVPIQRMANVSLLPAPGGPSTEELISRVDRGIYVVGDRSWSIDMQRYNFQFTGQRFYEIRKGQLVGQLRDVAYQATTTDFWGSLDAVGGPQTYVLGGAFNCGKGQPGQVAAVSHGCPTALFRNVNILNTRREGGR
ncbi:peptidase C69 [Frankia sp. CcI49]|uniref:TldD/PmbA family protein n=1 Tax=unclassified Frankia TaxID=2632575 RepID=UPI0006C9F693|nr:MULTISPECIES: TldD/PmbA family protein [unclassified Frankia]KPM53044.1 peptidase C69 [Frankia sp. R43]ONH58680.1 peptidase C69 [Frankia sp. CcI49]